MSDPESTDYVCPHEGCEFTSSEVGVKRHYGQVHEGSIAGVEVECSQCGGGTRKSPYQLDRSDELFCSMDCYSAWRSENISRADASGWRGGGRVTITCEQCGATVERWASHVQPYERTFCRGACYDVWRQEHTVAERDSPGWDATRTIVRRRDGHRCWFCGLPEPVHELLYGEELEVHHIFPLSAQQGDTVDDSNAPGKLLALCTVCHQRLEYTLREE